MLARNVGVRSTASSTHAIPHRCLSGISDPPCRGEADPWYLQDAGFVEADAADGVVCDLYHSTARSTLTRFANASSGGTAVSRAM